jgi:hypothetical protein
MPTQQFTFQAVGRVRPALGPIVTVNARSAREAVKKARTQGQLSSSWALVLRQVKHISTGRILFAG